MTPAAFITIACGAFSLLWLLDGALLNGQWIGQEGNEKQ